MHLIVIFAAIALLLAGAGVYGVMSYAITRAPMNSASARLQGQVGDARGFDGKENLQLFCRTGINRIEALSDGVFAIAMTLGTILIQLNYALALFYRPED